MKFSPLILVALVSVASAAPTARDGVGKCRAKPGKELSAAPSAAPSTAPTGSDGVEGGVKPVDISSSASAAPTADAAAASSSAAPTAAANATTDCKIGEFVNQSYHLDPNVVVQMPPSRGPDPKNTELIVPPGSVGINPEGGVPADDPIAKILLERINQFRSIYKAPPMTWNQTFSGYAVGFAKMCKFEHVMKGDGLFGEVLLDYGKLDKADLAYQAKRWIDGWMIEGKQWDFNNQKAVDGQTTGHWEVLTDPYAHQVGCGWQECGKIYCDTGKDWDTLWGKQIPSAEGKHVWPQTCEEIPWAWYIEPNEPDKVYPDTW